MDFVSPYLSMVRSRRIVVIVYEWCAVHFFSSRAFALFVAVVSGFHRLPLRGLLHFNDQY